MTMEETTRRLTAEDIEFLFCGVEDYIPKFLPTEMRACFLNKMTRPMRETMHRVRLINHPEALPRLRREFHQRIQRSIIEAGEGVGVTCAQSIGERQTQLTLNSFHQSGLAVATVVTGVPRFLELLNATKDPKLSSNRFLLKRSPYADGDPVSIPDIRRTLSHHVVSLTFGNIVKTEKAYIEKEEEVWYTAFETVYSNRFRDYHACLSFTLDLEQLFKYRISLPYLMKRLQAEFSDMECVFSPAHIGQLDIFVDVTNLPLQHVKHEPLPKFINESNCIQIYLEDVVYPRLMSIPICGIPGITKYHISKDKETLWIETEGSDMQKLAMLPFVDVSSLESNNMWEIYHLLGIEATREFLIHEFTSIVSSDGTFLNPVHILLLVDIMTHHGTIHSISRYGLKKEQVSVLSRSSFEESLDHFCNAAFFSEKEPVKAVSAAIMCGKRSKVGSGLCGLVVDWKQICESQASLETTG